MSDPNEHHCPRTDDGFFRITYKPTPFAGWHLFATHDRRPAHYPITITHCPFCGLRLETPEPAITVAATRSQWDDLRRHLDCLSRYYANLALLNTACNSRLLFWIDYLKLTLRDPQDAAAKDER